MAFAIQYVVINIPLNYNSEIKYEKNKQNNKTPLF